MKRLSTAILAFAIALVFVTYMVTYTVGYNQIAIIKTFGAATEPDPKLLEQGKDTGSVMQEPGLKFKWPWPIQRVQTYPTQFQVLQDTPEQLGLLDQNTLVINMSMTWRVKDPLAFSTTVGEFDKAEDILLAQMKDARSVISNSYRFDQLVNEDPSKVELDKLEAEIAQRLTDKLAQIKPSYGIEVVGVSIGKMLYAESTAAKVNERMTSTQERKAQEIISEGDSQAKAIVAEAESISSQLKRFAETVATQIEIVGINESNAYLARYAQANGDPDLAIYLRQLEAIEQILANRTTFLLDARTFSPLDVLVYGHGGKGNLSRMFGESKQAQLAPSPLSLEQQAEIYRQKIEALQAQIAEYEKELATRTIPVSLTADSIRIDTHAEQRP